MFLIVMAMGIAMTMLYVLTAYITCRNATIRQKTDAVGDYLDKLSLKMAANAYTVHPKQSYEITNDMNTISAAYDGRLIVTDASLKIIYDSYGSEVGKVLVSSEAIRAVRGTSVEYRDTGRSKVELTRPVYDSSFKGEQDLPECIGVVVFNFSTEECSSITKLLGRRLILAVIFAALLLITACAVITVMIAKPFGRISQFMNNVSDGYTDRELELGNYSEMDRILESFNTMMAKIADLEESRQEFVSNVSHELKTPLTSVKVLADSLISQPDVPIEMYREFMTDIDSEIDRENKIINDLLALVKLDRKSGDMHIAEVNLNEMLEIILRRLKPIAQAAQVALIYESYRDVTARVDEVKLSLAITNLIENGIKYNVENGTVTISLNSDHRFFIIRVSDTGIGIPESECEHIFDRFYRVDKMRSRETGGTGLGLSITRSIVQMHHGAIKVESIEGRGSTFTVKIPLSYIPEG